MTENKESEFLASMKALCVRYGVHIVKTVKGFGDEMETTYVFEDGVDDANNIYLDIEEIKENL